MKCFLKTALSYLAVLILLIGSVVPAFARGFDFEEEIKSFVPRGVNEVSLAVGETHRHIGAIWLPNAECMTSDDSVVTVDPVSGEVTAVGEGSASVAIVASANVFQLVRYDVGNTQENPLSVFGFLDWFFVIWLVLLVLILACIIYVIVTTVWLSHKSMRERVLPERRETPATVRRGLAPLETCLKCGKPFGDASFCAECGTAKQQPNVWEFSVKGKMNVLRFEEMINEWLAENPYIYHCRLRLETHASLWRPFVTRKFFVKKAVLEFFVSDTPRTERYGFAFLYSFRPFGPLGFNEEKHVENWKKNNPDARVISSHGGRVQHFGNNGFYAQYYNHVFFCK